MRSIWLSAVAALAVAGSAAAQVFTPIPVTGYTQDVIADAGGTAIGTTTAPFDEPAAFSQNNAYVLYEQGYNAAAPTRGVPVSGLLVTSPSRSYQLGPINGNNSLQLINPNPVFGQPVLSGTLTLATPARDAALSLLLADGVGNQPSNGGFPGTLTVNWSNGNATSYSYTVYDWFLLSGTPGPNSGFAITDLDRAIRGTGVPQNVTTADPRLYYYDIDLSPDPNYLAGALINSVTATRQSGFQSQDTTNIMGLSGAISVPEPSTMGLVGAAAGLARWRRRRGRRPRPGRGANPTSSQGRQV
jgi:hypothetical protein